MRRICRVVLLSAIGLMSIQPATVFVPSLQAGAIPAAASRAKKKNKPKPRKTKKILKGRHGSHKRKPA